MADTTPLINQINVNMAIRMDDAVTGGDNGIKAAADGLHVTSEKRNYYTNNALLWLARQLIARYGPTGVGVVCQGLIGSATVTLGSTGVAIPKNFLAPIHLLKSGVVYKPLSKADIESDQFYQYNTVYAIEGNTLYAYVRTNGTLGTATGTGTLYYVKQDRKDATTGAEAGANTAPDTTVDASYHEALTAYACALACFDKSMLGDDEAERWQTKGNKFMAEALSLLPGNNAE